MPPHPLPQNTLTTHIPISSTLSQRLWILRTLHLGHFISRVSLWPLWLRLVTWVNPDLTSSVTTDPYNTADPGGQGVALPSLHLSTITDWHVPWTRCSMMSVRGRKSPQLWLSRLLELSFPPPTVIIGQCDNRVYAIRLSFLLLLFPATDFRWWRSIKSHWPHFQSR